MPNMIKKVLLLMLILLLVAGCADNSSPKPGGTAIPNQNNQQTQSQPNPVVKMKVYFATTDALNLSAETFDYAPQDYSPQNAILRLIQGPKSSNLVSVMPKGTELLGLYIKNKTAYVNFNGKIRKNYGGGSAGEILLVAAIANTLTEFEQITKVQILVDGKKVDTIGGHIDVREPVGRSTDIIK